MAAAIIARDEIKNRLLIKIVLNITGQTGDLENRLLALISFRHTAEAISIIIPKYVGWIRKENAMW